MNLPRCYIASPLGFNEAGRHYYANVMLPALRTTVEVVDPWSFVDSAEIAEAARANRLRELWLTVGHRNLEAIKGCQLLAAVLEGQDVDSGTAVEVGFAAAHGILSYGLRSDLREAGEAGMAVNLQVEATIESTGGRVVTALEELVTALHSALPPR